MQASYPAVYRDSSTEISTTIENDGALLRMSLGGVELEGPDFDSLEVVRSNDPATLSRLTFAAGSLCACTLDFAMPVTLVTDAGEAHAALQVALLLGQPRADGGIDRETLRLELVREDTRIASAGRSAWFEDELTDLQRQLPDGWYLKMCFGCGLSDYGPGGHGVFGGLACFRDQKAAYRAVQTKADIFRVLPSRTGWVQETFLCPEFERRRPGTGYRG